MSKHQTRRAVSLTRELHAELIAFAEARQISAAQVVAQGIRAVIGGAVELEPAADPVVLAKASAAKRAQASSPSIEAPPLERIEQLAQESDDWGPV